MRLQKRREGCYADGGPDGSGRNVRVRCVQGPPAESRVRLIQAAYEAAVAQGRYEAPKARRAPSRGRLYRDGRLTLLAPYFDYAYYAFENPDFSASGLDELEHFNFFGWRNLRNPAAWFDTAYYLAGNPDVRASGDNPFWHYIFKGRAEGRATQPPRAAERAILDALVAPEARAAEPPPDLPRLGAEALAARLQPRLAGAEGLLYCLDVAAPAAPSAIPGFLCLQASPLRAAHTLKLLPAAWSQTRLALDGETLGVATDAAIAKALDALGEALPPRRILAVRSLVGASLEGLLAVETALAAQRRLLFLDDFSSLCESARLLRNDVAFCAAPAPDSQGCAVCIYGESRRSLLAGLERLFERCRFTVVAPQMKRWRCGAARPPCPTKPRPSSLRPASKTRRRRRPSRRREKSASRAGRCGSPSWDRRRSPTAGRPSRASWRPAASLPPTPCTISQRPRTCGRAAISPASRSRGRCATCWSRAASTSS